MKNITGCFNDFYCGKPCMNCWINEYSCPEKFYGYKVTDTQKHLNIRL